MYVTKTRQFTRGIPVEEGHQPEVGKIGLPAWRGGCSGGENLVLRENAHHQLSHRLLFHDLLLFMRNKDIVHIVSHTAGCGVQDTMPAPENKIVICPLPTGPKKKKKKN